MPSSTDRSIERRRMVDRQIAARGISDPAVLGAMASVPREHFVDADVERAYEDVPLPIGEGQTISQPFIVAAMAVAAELKPDDRVLEVGTGSGYAAAVLSGIVRRVFTVELHRSLAEVARRRFERLGYTDIEVHVGDGSLGWDRLAPYQAILVTAGAPEEVPPALLGQLVPDGRLIIPRGESRAGQRLVRIRRIGESRSYAEESLFPVRFVPLLGEAGWTSDARTGPYR